MARLLDTPEVREKFGNIGKTKFAAEIRPRLRARGGEVALGPRTIRFDEAVVDELIEEELRAARAAGPEDFEKAKAARLPVAALKAKADRKIEELSKGDADPNGLRLPKGKAKRKAARRR